MEAFYTSENHYIGYLTISIDIKIWDSALKSALKSIEKFSGMLDYNDLIFNDGLFSLAISFLSPHYFYLASSLFNLRDAKIIDSYVVDINEEFVEIEYYCYNKLRFEISEYLS